MCENCKKATELIGRRVKYIKSKGAEHHAICLYELHTLARISEALNPAPTRQQGIDAGVIKW